MGVAERIKAWRHALGLTQERFAERAGISQATLIGYEVGQRKPGADALAAIARTGVNMTWLLTGEGEMRPSPAPEPESDQQLAPDHPLARRWAKIAELLDAMPEQESAALFDEFFARARSTAEVAELRRAVADLTAAVQRTKRAS